MSEKVVQVVTSWEGWPDDVRGRLQAWNRLFLLSFYRTGDFRCAGCNRDVIGHPNGNALLRPERHAKGVARCEDCLVAIARTYESPPVLQPNKRKTSGGVRRLERRLARTRVHLERMDAYRAKLQRQIRQDQLYIDRLEAAVPVEVLRAIKDDMRGVRVT